MANSKISALTSATTPLAGTEVLPVVQSGATTQVSVANLTAGRAVSALSFASTTGASFATTSGNVGIGTSSGIAKLSNTSTAWAGGNATDGFLWRSTQNDWTATVLATPATGAGYGLRLHTLGATTSDYPLYISSGATAGTLKFSVQGDGTTTFTGGNLVQGTAAKGVNFTANTPKAGMTSQLLNWYEEGTWTTTVSDISNFTGTPTLASGKYTKIGRLVAIEGKFSGSVTTANSTSYFKFTLPFSRSATSDGGAGIVFSTPTFQSGGVYNVLADTTTAYVVYAPPALLPSGANTFFFSYSYNA